MILSAFENRLRTGWIWYGMSDVNVGPPLGRSNILQHHVNKAGR